MFHPDVLNYDKDDIDEIVQDENNNGELDHVESREMEKDNGDKTDDDGSHDDDENENGNDGSDNTQSYNKTSLENYNFNKRIKHMESLFPSSLISFINICHPLLTFEEMAEEMRLPLSEVVCF
jgi:hypothetical protein